MTLAEYDELFLMDDDGCYVNLVIPQIGECPELNLIGKRPQDYKWEEIVQVKAYRRYMWEQVES